MPVTPRNQRGLDRAVARASRPPARRSAQHGSLNAIEGLSALSLDALSSVAYGPQAIVLVLVAAGAGAIKWTLPIALVITGMLVLLVISYTQVIVAHPDGGGAYAVSKQSLGRIPALLAAASLVVDYVLTVAVSLSAGAASLASVFPGLSDHVLLISVIGLAFLTAINMFGITESARVLLLPLLLFVLSIAAILVVDPFHSRPEALIGTKMQIHAVTGVGIVLLLKAFAAGCSAVTGIEAIANGVPSFKEPRTAQKTEVSLGVILGIMLVGLAILIKVHHVLPRGGVTILAQLTAGAFGKGPLFYVSNLAVTAVLGLAANTSFGGLPVLMSLLARDHRLPHLFYLRSERPVYRHGIVALAILALLLLIAVNAQTNSLIPLYAIGVFIGFTLSQIGLVRHWLGERPSHWRIRVGLNGAGATMTAVAVVVFLASKFVAGAWVVVITVPTLMVVFARIEGYYDRVGRELRYGFTPERPQRHESIVIVPTTTVSRLTELALSAALSMGDTVVAVAVAGDEDECDAIRHGWEEWDPGVSIEVLLDPHRSLVRTVLRYIDGIDLDNVTVTVLIPEVLPTKRRHEILHNQRGRLLEAVLKSRTEIVVATLPFHIHD
jgi:amino acid transporter